MKRLYKFFFILFLVLFVISFIYGTIISWVTFKVLQAATTKNVVLGDSSFLSFYKYGLIQAFLYSLVLLLMIIFLLKRSVSNEQKFTIRNIVVVCSWFFLITSLVYAIHYISFFKGWDFSQLLLLLGPQLFLPSTLWFPFPLAWLSLFIILMVRIKKVE